MIHEHFQRVRPRATVYSDVTSDNSSDSTSRNHDGHAHAKLEASYHPQYRGRLLPRNSPENGLKIRCNPRVLTPR